MNTNPIVFALSNPDPEILPEDAVAAGALVPQANQILQIK